MDNNHTWGTTGGVFYGVRHAAIPRDGAPAAQNFLRQMLMRELLAVTNLVDLHYHGVVGLSDYIVLQ